MCVGSPYARMKNDGEDGVGGVRGEGRSFRAMKTKKQGKKMNALLSPYCRVFMLNKLFGVDS